MKSIRSGARPLTFDPQIRGSELFKHNPLPESHTITRSENALDTIPFPIPLTNS